MDPRDMITSSLMQPQQPGMGAQAPPQMSATAGVPQQQPTAQPTLGGLGAVGGLGAGMAGVPATPGGPTQFPNQSIMQGLKAGAGGGAGNVTPLAGTGNFNMPDLSSKFGQY